MAGLFGQQTARPGTLLGLIGRLQGLPTPQEMALEQARTEGQRRLDIEADRVQLARDQFEAQQQAGPGLAEIGTPSPKDFTVESLAAYQQTGDPRVLQRWEDPMARMRANLAQDRLTLQQLQFARVPDNDRRELGAQADNLFTLSNLMSTISPNFFGYGADIVGDAETLYQRRFGDSYEFTDWWQQYEQWKQNFIRSQAGANLTEPELRSYARFTVKPSDSYQVARRNIERQVNLQRRAYARYRNNLAGAGYDVGDYATEPTDPISNGSGLPPMPPGFERME